MIIKVSFLRAHWRGMFVCDNVASYFCYYCFGRLPLFGVDSVYEVFLCHNVDRERITRYSILRVLNASGGFEDNVQQTYRVKYLVRLNCLVSFLLPTFLFNFTGVHFLPRALRLSIDDHKVRVLRAR